jgi:F-type H+-transporting ATPase subunit delta
MNKEEKVIGYSLALFSIAEEENKVNEYFIDAKMILETFSNPDYLPLIDILNSRGLTLDKKEKIINEVFVNVEQYISNFMKLLVFRSKIKLITNIMRVFIKHCCEFLKIKEGTVYSATVLEKAEIKKIEKKISLEQDCKVSLVNLIDKELISGIRIVIGNNIIENSIISDLEEMKKMLKGVKKWD